MFHIKYSFCHQFCRPLDSSARAAVTIPRHRNCSPGLSECKFAKKYKASNLGKVSSFQVIVSSTCSHYQLLPRTQCCLLLCSG